MPKPKLDEGESEKEFMERCMGDEVMQEEYPDEGQRYAVCISIWEEESGSRAAPGRRGELRYFDIDALEIRAGEGENEKWLTGHGAVYDKLSIDLGGFRELFEYGTFAESIKKDDIRSLRDHASSYILGRNKAGTLLLEEDRKGVRFEVNLPDTSYARDLLVSVERRDVTGCSIMFGVNPKGERWFVDGKEVDMLDAWMMMWDGNKRKVERHVNSAWLADIGPVTFPAYPQTDVKARSMELAAGIDYEALGMALVKSKTGLKLDENERQLLAKAGDIIRGCLVEKAKPDGRGTVKRRAVGLERLRFNL